MITETATTATLSLGRPDDWHVHLRDGAMLDAVAPFTARRFGRAIIMPNLDPPITDRGMAKSYRERIFEALGDKRGDFQPLMTCYLTERTDGRDLAAGYADGIFAAAKLYPAGATTNSAAGVTDMARISGVLEVMQKAGMPLLVHGEVTDPGVDIFDREAVFIERVLEPLLGQFPELPIVFEHITTEQAVDFVRGRAGRLAATITAHHLMINRNAIFEGGIRPHYYCLPVAKRERHRLALRQAATSGEACFFLGTDSAPHVQGAKEQACGCAGIFSAPAAIELYAQVFEDEGALGKLEAFASLNGAGFYGLPASEDRITLERKEWWVTEAVALADGQVIRPLMAGERLNWRLAGA